MAAKKKDTQEVVNKLEKTESLFSKEQLLSAERFRDRRDIVNALLLPDREYTITTVEQMIEKYMKGTVI